MNADFLKNYVKNLPNKFSSRENENARLFKNINKALKFLNKKLIEPGTRLLDLGSGNSSFYEYCLSKKIICNKLDGAFDNINFEDSQLNLKQDTYDFDVLGYFDNENSVNRFFDLSNYIIKRLSL
jgi:hypothetical protein